MRFIFGLLIFFFIGFFVHALFFPDLFYNALGELNKKNIVISPTPGEKKTDSNFFTYVTYKDGKFRPGNVTIGRSNYLVITNVNKKDPMWLVSDNKLLNTERGFMESERLTILLNELGRFTVVEKNRPEALLIVTVKP